MPHSHKNHFQHLKIQLQAILVATTNFSSENYIGRGGFGSVYKGKLRHSKGVSMVAVKRLDPTIGKGESGFWTEIMTLSLYSHENVVSLLGYCDDWGEKIIVYEYASKKSLDSYLSCDKLTWLQRLKICVGAAHGLAYLHSPVETTHLRIVHRDIKSSNILLDDNWNAKISDFGLSKFAPANNQFSFMESAPAGTRPYIDPVYMETGLLTKESDVYSFGIVLFEVLCGRLCYDNNGQSLIGHLREYYEQNKIGEIIYSNMKDEISTYSLTLFLDIAYQCIERVREERPSMIQVVSTLERALDAQVIKAPKAVVHRAAAGILKVKVLATSSNLFDASNHNLVLYIDPVGPQKFLNSTTKYNKKNAEWNEDLTLYVDDFRAQCLSVVVNKRLSENEVCYVGKATMKVGDLTPRVPSTCNLGVKDDNYNDYNIGDLKVEVSYIPTTSMEADEISSVQNVPIIRNPEAGGLLTVVIHGAVLHHQEKNSSVSLYFGGEIRKTKCMTNTNNPMWLQEFIFALNHPPTDENLHVEVINNDSMGSIGCFSISLANVVKTKHTNTICSLEPCYFVDGQHRYNKLQLELHWKAADSTWKCLRAISKHPIYR